jgi:hypothetical protein
MKVLSRAHHIHFEKQEVVGTVTHVDKHKFWLALGGE